MLKESEKFKLYVGNYTTEELYDLIKKGVSFTNYLYNSEKILKNISILETNKYREIISCLEKNNLELINKIEIERNKYVKSQIELINEFGIFSFLYNQEIEMVEKILPKEAVKQIKINLKYNDLISVERILKNYTEKCLLEYIIDLYFKDITYNFISNLKIMLKYVKNIKENIIHKDRLIFYNKLLKFHELSLEEQKNIYFNYNQNIDYKLNFYEDYQNCKKHAYNNLNNSIITKEELNKCYNKTLSQENGTEIYELNGEDFYLFVHVCKLNRDDKKSFPFEKNCNRTISLSLIGNDNIGIYKTTFEKIVFGFEKIKADNIIHLFNSDSYTASYSGSKKIQKIYTPKDLLDETYGYNEILYSQKNNEYLYPSYIVCFDEIREIDLYFSKLKNIPIIKINSFVYRKNPVISDLLEERYKEANELQNITSYRLM